MREERVTINILEWLKSRGWHIVCFDFPQSGTGILLHPNRGGDTADKNKGAIIPDIIAVKNGRAVVFENKDRFVLSDFDKIRQMKVYGGYSDALDALLRPFSIVQIFYGVGMPTTPQNIDKASAQSDAVDFIMTTDESKSVTVHVDTHGAFAAE